MSAKNEVDANTPGDLIARLESAVVAALAAALAVPALASGAVASASASAHAVIVENGEHFRVAAAHTAVEMVDASGG